VGAAEAQPTLREEKALQGAGDSSTKSYHRPKRNSHTKSSISRTPHKAMPSKIGGQDAKKRPKDHKVWPAVALSVPLKAVVAHLLLDLDPNVPTYAVL